MTEKGICMSKEGKDKFGEWMTWCLRLIVPAMIMWAWRDLSGTKDIVIKLDKDFAVMNGSRYTAADHVKYSTEISGSLASSDKRITRLEDTVQTVKESLQRIETKITTIK